MAAKLTSKARNAIATCSTGGVGTYYTSPGAFFTRLEWVLRDLGLQPESPEHPPIHTTDGKGKMAITLLGMDTPLFSVVYTWHRMEETGNWEMVCYPSC
jgi:hypothetical protein